VYVRVIGESGIGNIDTKISMNYGIVASVTLWIGVVSNLII
jgi:hypothetical protein